MHSHSFLLAVTLLVAPVLTYAQESKRPIILPGKGHINVEDLKNVDINMDISQLSLAECRIVRNALAARQGHCFQSKDLRSLFSTTSWYDSLFWARNELVEESFSQHSEENEGEDIFEDYRASYAKQADMYVPLKYTKAELAFVQRLREREAELAKENFRVPAGQLVNVGNILNPWQIQDFPQPLRQALARDGFAIIDTPHDQLFHVYEQNDYTVFPCFVTTDVYLQLFHFYFDCLLRDIEEERLDSCVFELHRMIRTDLDKVVAQKKNKRMVEAAEWLQAYTAVAKALQREEPITDAPARYAGAVRDEVDKCTGAETDTSPFLGYTNVMFPYALFRPRGHYNHSEKLQRYFRTMMWLQTAPFSTDSIDQMRRAALLAHIVGTNPTITQLYRQITEPLTFLLGAPDNVDILQVYDEVKRSPLSIDKLLASESEMVVLANRVKQVAAKQTRIIPKDALSSVYKVNLMPQRYMPDAEVLQEMADTETHPITRRKAPKALDLMAALGVSSAEKILLEELREGERWPKYSEKLGRMKERMNQVNWKETVATNWIDAIHDLQTLPDHAPYFMRTHAWQKKSLNCALASYAELKHDAILYAKQPFGAECGGGGAPEPVIKGYVEPSIPFWRKAVELNLAYAEVLRKYGLMTEKAEEAGESIGGMAQFLLEVSEKELAGTPLTNSENDQIEIIGSNIEYISLNLASSREQYLSSWSDVTGADRKVACIADVYTANSLNIPSQEKAVLYEGVGPAHEIYVVVEIEGQLWLTRGAVFSYRELERPLSDPRLTDEEWQEHLETHPDDGIPSWMQDIIVPLKQKPQPNAEVFYSSGC